MSGDRSKCQGCWRLRQAISGANIGKAHLPVGNGHKSLQSLALTRTAPKVWAMMKGVTDDGSIPAKLCESASAWKVVL